MLVISFFYSFFFENPNDIYATLPVFAYIFYIYSPISFRPRLVVVLVAEVALQGAQDIADGKIRALAAADVAEVEHGVEGQGRAPAVARAAADGVAAGDVAELPLAEDVVDVQVVHEEGRVAGRGDGVGHGGADTVVALSVETVCFH